MEESAPCATEQAEEAEPDLPLVDFGVVVGGKARFDVCRLFLASLQLVSAVAECLYRVPLLALLVSLYEPGAMANPGESTQRLGYFYSGSVASRFVGGISRAGVDCCKAGERAFLGMLFTTVLCFGSFFSGALRGHWLPYTWLLL